MKLVLLFAKRFWKKADAVEFSVDAQLTGSIRVGFSHLVFIGEGDWDSLPPVATKPVVCLEYDHKGHNPGTHAPGTHVVGSVSRHGVEVSASGQRNLDVGQLLSQPNNVAFDLEHFAHVPATLGNTSLYYEAFKESALTHGLTPNMLFSEAADKVFHSLPSDESKKLLLDMLTLRASAILVLRHVHGQDILSRYAAMFSLTCAVRAQIEKTMLFLARLDPALDYKQLDSSKRIRSTFLKQAAQSGYPATARMAAFLEGVEILDGRYRSPELHKTGRLWGLLYSGHVDTSLNEILAFLNELQGVTIGMIETLLSAHPSAGDINGEGRE